MSVPKDRRFAPQPGNVCVCFHVPAHKIVQYIKVRHPRVVSQLSDCYGAGTGCGWCIPFLEKIYEAVRANPDAQVDLGLSETEYLARRRQYHERIKAKRMKDSEQ